MKKIKILARIIFYMSMLILLCIAFLHFALMYIAPLESVKAKIIKMLEEQTNTSVSIGSISASIFDFRVQNLSINIKDKPFTDIGTMYIHFSLINLLKGQVKVQRITLEDINIYIVKNKNGEFNFNPILQSPICTSEPKEEQKLTKEEKIKQEEESVLNLLLHRTQLLNTTISYVDEQANMTFVLNKTAFNMKSFNLNNNFKIDFSTMISAKINDIKIDDLHIALSANTNLNKVNLEKANIDISHLVIRLKDTIILTKGVITNFTNPKTDLIITILNLSSNTFKSFADITEFNIPKIETYAVIDTNLENSDIKINKLKTTIFDSIINITGDVNYGKKDIYYNLNIYISLLLEKLLQSIEMTKEYKAKGTIDAKLNVKSNSSMISGTVNLIDISAYTPQLGDITAINSSIAINNINDIQIPKLTGKINTYPFNSSLYYIIGKDKGNITVTFDTKKLFGKMEQKYLDSIGQKKEEAKPNTNIKENKESDFFLPPLEIKTDINIGELEIPFLSSKNVNFKLDMKDVTPKMDKTNGILALNSYDGTIKDIYKLTQSNAIMKGLFLSLKVVSDVINALNVLDILQSIGSAITSSKEEVTQDDISDEEAAEKNRKLDGQIDFLSFITALNFADGKGTFDKCSFVSNLLSFKVSGIMNFRENLLDMTVNAAPGKHEDDGIMPLTMKIGGTMDEPSGSLSLLGSISTLVGDALMKNVVSSKLKSGFMKLIGLKKHDEKGNNIEDTNSVNISSNTEKTEN